MIEENYYDNHDEIDDISWYSSKVIGLPREIIGFCWYFGVHLYVMPMIVAYLLYHVFGWSLDQITYKGQMISDLISGLCLVLIMWPLIKDNLIRFKNNFINTVWYGVRLYIPNMFGNAIVGAIIIALTGITNSSNQSAIEEILQHEFLGVFIPAVLVAPLIEELIFRGIIYRRFRKWGVIPGMLASGLAFGVLHCYTDLLAGDWASAAYIFLYMTMGCFMCKAYEDSKNMFGGVVLHFVNNFIAIVLTIL